MIKRILIPLDPSPYCLAAIEKGCYLAKLYDAELTGMTILDLAGIEKSVGGAPVGMSYMAKQLREEKQNEAAKTIREIENNFKSICEKQEVSYNISKEKGNPGETIIGKSIYYDLVIIGLRKQINDRKNK